MTDLFAWLVVLVVAVVVMFRVLMPAVDGYTAQRVEADKCREQSYDRTPC